MAHDLFISYSSKDKGVADAVCAGLEAQGIRCWIAPRDVGPGQDWAATIVDAIEQCRIFVIILSSGSNNSSQVLREVERAVNGGKTIIPFRIEDLEPSKSLGYFLSVSHWLDAMSEPLEAHIDILARNVKRLLTDEDEAPQPSAAEKSGRQGMTPAGMAGGIGRPDHTRLYIIIAVLLTILVLAGGWFVFYERTHQPVIQQPQMMNRGMMRRNWDDGRNWEDSRNWR